MNNKKVLESKIPFFLYYSTMYELQTNLLKINNLKGFKYKSIEESMLWRTNFNMVSNQIPNTFYAALEEIRFIYNEFMNHEESVYEKDDKFIGLTIRCSILGTILFHSGASLIYDDIKKMNKNLFYFLSKCNSLSEEFLSEFQIDDYKTVSMSLHDFAAIYMKSNFLKKAQKEGEKLFELIELIVKNGILDKFFSPYLYLENSLVGILNKNNSKEFFEAIVFSDSVLWVTSTGESSFLTYCFLDKYKINSSFMLEAIRMILKADKYSLSETQVKIFRETFASFVLLNNEDKVLKNTLMQSQNIEVLRKKFWLANNKRRISEISHELSTVINDVFEDFRKEILEKNQEEAYYLLFSNLYNSIENLILEHDCLYPEAFLEEERCEIAEILSEKIISIILKDNE